MYHAQWGFRNNEFKAQRETPFVFLKLAFRPNTNFHMHHFHHQPKYSSAHSYYVQWTPQQRDILPVKTSFLCSLLERHHPITEPVFDDKINFCDPFCSLAFCFTVTDIRHNSFFFLFFFHLCSCWRWKGLNLETTKMYSCKWKSTNMNILMLKNSPFHTVRFSLCNARNKTLGLCPERLFLNSLLSDTQRKQHRQD